MSTEELLKDRGAVYGDVRANMNCAAELIEVWYRYGRGNPGMKFDAEYNTIAFNGCIQMVFHKLARICTGNLLHEDNYKDICGYTELARKIAMGEMDK